MRQLLVCALLLVMPCAGADDVAPRQYADGFLIRGPQGGAVYRVILDEEVYRSARHADLGDLRVFNSDDEPVPHSLLRSSARREAPDAQAELPFYPLYRAPGQEGDSALHIAITADGSIIDLPARHDDTLQLQAYVVDSAEHTASLTGLDLQWPQPARGFVATVVVSSSADLTAWRTVGSATLADLNHGGHRLQQQHIDLHQPLQRYLRLDWPADRTDMRLEAVRARLQAPEPPRAQRRTRVVGHAASAPERGWLFDASAALPVQRARIVLEHDNTLVQLRWYSRNAPDALWHDHGSATSYRLSVEGAALESPDLQLATRRDRFWRVEVLDGDAAALGATPRLELGWQPDELRFMARGAAPFRLAVGSWRRSPPGSGVEQMLAGLDQRQRDAMMTDATLGPRFVLGGEAALQPVAPPTPWQRYLLWTVLVAGVLLLARMALHLYREINSGASGEG